MKRFAEREQEILHLRFVERKTLVEIGAIYGLSRQRIEQIVSNATVKHEHINVASERAEVKRRLKEEAGLVAGKISLEEKKQIVLNNLHLPTWTLMEIANYKTQNGLYAAVRTWTGKTLMENRIANHIQPAPRH